MCVLSLLFWSSLLMGNFKASASYYYCYEQYCETKMDSQRWLNIHHQVPDIQLWPFLNLSSVQRSGKVTIRKPWGLTRWSYLLLARLTNIISTQPKEYTQQNCSTVTNVWETIYMKNSCRCCIIWSLQQGCHILFHQGSYAFKYWNSKTLDN